MLLVKLLLLTASPAVVSIWLVAKSKSPRQLLKNYSSACINKAYGAFSFYEEFF
jgi:hypothetical protein